MGITQAQLEIDLFLKNNGIKSTLESVINAMKKLGVSSEEVDKALGEVGKEFGSMGKKANDSLQSINCKKLVSELESVKKVLKSVGSDTSKEMNKVKKSMESLDNKMASSKKRIEELNESIAKTGEQGGDASKLEKQLQKEQRALETAQSKLNGYKLQLADLTHRETQIASATNLVSSQMNVLNVASKNSQRSTKELGKTMGDTTTKEETLKQGTDILKDAIGKLSGVGLGSMDGFKVAMTLALESLRETAKNIKSEIKDLESKANSLQGNTKPRFGRAKPLRRMDTYEDTQDEDVYEFDEKSGTAIKVGTISGASKKAYNETAKEVNNLIDKIESLTKDLDSLNTCSKTVDKTMRDVASSFEKAGESQEDLNNSNNKNVNSSNKLKNTLSQLTQKWRENNQGTKEAVKANKEATQSFNTLGGSISNLMAKMGIIFGAYQLINFGKECLNLGSDLQEVQNVIDNVFSGMTGRVEEFCQKSLEMYGLTELQSKKFIGIFGAMWKSAGAGIPLAEQLSEKMIALVGDVASFYNLSPEESYNKLKAILTGETKLLVA